MPRRRPPNQDAKIGGRAAALGLTRTEERHSRNSLAGRGGGLAAGGCQSRTAGAGCRQRTTSRRAAKRRIELGWDQGIAAGLATAAPRAWRARPSDGRERCYTGIRLSAAHPSTSPADRSRQQAQGAPPLDLCAHWAVIYLAGLSKTPSPRDRRPHTQQEARHARTASGPGRLPLASH